MNKWNDLCFIVSTHQKKNTKENILQLEIENFLEKLGWSRRQGEVVTQKHISVGSNQTLIPDITIESNNKVLFVVELKRPNESVEKHKKQLISYMRQLKLHFGVLLGDKFQLYYDDTTEDGTEAQKVFEATFTENNPEAEELLSLLTKEQFGRDKLLIFAEKQLEKIQESEVMNEIQEYVEEQLSHLQDKLYKELQEEYDSKLVKKVFEHLNIAISPIAVEEVSLNNLDTTPVEKLSIEFVPNDLEVFKKLLLEKKVAKVEWYYNNGKVEYKTWKVSRFKQKSPLLRNVYSRPEAKNGKWKELGLAKVVYKID